MKYNVSVTDMYSRRTLVESSVMEMSMIDALLEHLGGLNSNTIARAFLELANKRRVSVEGRMLLGRWYRFVVEEIVDEVITESDIDEPYLMLTLWHRVSLEEFLHEMPMSRRDVTAALVEYVEAPMDKINEKLNKLIDGGGGYVRFLSFDFPDGAYSATVQMKG